MPSESQRENAMRKCLNLALLLLLSSTAILGVGKEGAPLIEKKATGKPSPCYYEPCCTCEPSRDCAGMQDFKNGIERCQLYLCVDMGCSCCVLPRFKDIDRHSEPEPLSGKCGQYACCGLGWIVATVGELLYLGTGACIAQTILNDCDCAH